ncbi:MAG: histidinol-phosphate transaminase [Candidatus Ancaeobacter aquaticus]|nr:histidinol-phosphate transaminase [Candidatus Ancaeobacter aquaticus]
MSIYKLAKKEVLKIKPYEPGKPIDELAREMGLKSIIKMASNENVLGPSQKAVKAMQRVLAKVSLYPDGGAYDLKKKLSQKYRIAKENIIVGNGSSEILEMIAQAFLNKNDAVVTCWPTFTIYSIITQIAQAHMIKVPLKNFTYDLEGIQKKITKRTKLVLISNPNNPTGTYVNKKALGEFIDTVGENVLVVIDEAYVEFADEKDFPDTLPWVKKKKNIIVVRTFSKIAGMAGLRLGYGFASREVIDILNRVRPPFNTNSIAQVAGTVALDDSVHMNKTKKMVKDGKKYLYASFDMLGLEYVKTSANFILVKVGNAKKVFTKMVRKGVIIRAMDTFDLPQYIRVTVGTSSDNKRFIECLHDCL